MKRILVIDDDPGIRANVLDLLEAEGYDAIGASDGRAGIAEALARPPDLVLCDITMPNLDGYEVLEAMHSHESTRGVPFVFLTAKADRDDVRMGMNLGADDYLTKPFARADLLDAIRARLVRAERRAKMLAPNPPDSRSASDLPPAEVVVLDPRMRDLYAVARRAALGPISVLILGETGVGKDVLARAIHQASPRAKGPLVALNCAALPETLLESELFGHEKGAFTGAGPARPGLFEAAQGGTVFLDEIGDIPLTTQVKILRVLEERKVMRVGARSPIPIDLRFVSATNKDIEADSDAGKFRSDLLYRLNGVTLHVPPLRERKLEIQPLAEVFLASASNEMGRDPPRIGDDALEAFFAYDWPGNIRELRHAMERAALLCTEDTVRVSHLPPRVSGVVSSRPVGSRSSDAPPAAEASPRSEASGDAMKNASRAAVEEIERRRIEDALARCGGNQTQAAELLGISRRTLVSRLSQYAFPRPRKKSS